MRSREDNLLNSLTDYTGIPFNHVLVRTFLRVSVVLAATAFVVWIIVWGFNTFGPALMMIGMVVLVVVGVTITICYEVETGRNHKYRKDD